MFTNQRLTGREILVPKSVMNESIVIGLLHRNLQAPSQTLKRKQCGGWLAVGAQCAGLTSSEDR